MLMVYERCLTLCMCMSVWYAFVWCILHLYLFMATARCWYWYTVLRIICEFRAKLLKVIYLELFVTYIYDIQVNDILLVPHCIICEMFSDKELKNSIFQTGSQDLPLPSKRECCR